MKHLNTMQVFNTFIIIIIIFASSSNAQPHSPLKNLSLPTNNPNNQPSVSKLNALCQAYLTKLIERPFPPSNQVVYEARHSLKVIIETTLLDLINDCQMIHQHSMTQQFDLHFAGFRVSIGDLLKSIKQVMTVLNYTGEAYSNSYLSGTNPVHDWKRKIIRWKSFMRLMYTRTGLGIPVKLCSWYDRMKNVSDETSRRVSDVVSMQSSSSSTSSTHSTHSLTSTSSASFLLNKRQRLRKQIYLQELMVLYRSINSALRNTTDFTLIEVDEERAMIDLTKMFISGGRYIERLRYAGELEIINKHLLRLITAIRVMLEKMSRYSISC